MRSCWTFSPSDRIQFRAIVEELIPYESEDFHLHAYYHTQPKNTQTTSVANETTHHDEEDLLLVDDDDSIHH